MRNMSQHQRPRRRFQRAVVLGAAALLASGHVLAQTAPLADPSAPAAAEPAPADSGGEAATTEIETARVHFQRGIEFFNDESYEAALVEFQRAYEIAPSYQILYNTGRIHVALKNYARALRDLRQYLAEGGANITDDRKAQVSELIQSLQQKVATLQIVSKIDGTLISIDDHPVGTAPIKDLFVNPGDRRVSASKPGFLPVTVVVTVTATEARKLEISPTKVAQSKVVVERSNIAPVIAWTATGLLTAGAVASGIVALKAEKDLNERKDTEIGAPKGAFDDDADKVKTWAIATDALAAGALIAGGISVYLTFFSEDAAEHAVAAPAPRLGLAVTPRDIALHGTF
jgi:tetratricopeptide (TPR) repeat protein